MSIGALLTFVLLGTFTPGPNNIMAMERARRVGFWGSRFFIMGMVAGFFLVMLFCAAFNLMLDKILPSIQSILGAVGAVYMLWLAIKPFLPSRHGVVSDPGGAFLSGMALQFLNPKLILYGIVVMSSFILPHTGDPMLLGLCAVGLTAIGLASLVCWALFGAVFQKYFSEHERATNVVMALLMVWCAVAISGVDLRALLGGRG